MLKYHILAMLLGLAADRFFGDPRWFPHPVIFIGRWIGFLDKKLNLKRRENITYDKKSNIRRGRLLVCLVSLPVFIITFGIMTLCYMVHPALAVAYEAFITCCCMATKSLYLESKKVSDSIKHNDKEDLSEAKKALSMIVGRDTKDLNETGILKAVIETIAENCSDGVIAPLFWMMLLGPAGGMTYKSINTMDSMVGYKNDTHEDFGRAAALLDDVVNFIPARLTAIFAIVFSAVYRKFDAKNAWKVYKRDRFKHSSPNSAQSEAAFAGALGVRLGGGASYFGVWHDKPVIGEGGRDPVISDVRRAHELMYGTLYIPSTVLVIVFMIQSVIFDKVFIAASMVFAYVVIRDIWVAVKRKNEQ